MEDKLIKAFLAVSHGSGYGDGDGSGSGYGSGYGDGSGYGSGYGDGDGDGSGSGYGSGYGDGDGDGDGSGSGYGDSPGSGSGSGYGNGYGFGDSDGSGYGSGYGDGDGDGDGSGYGLLSIYGRKVYYIDGMATLVDSVHGQYAMGHLVNSDLTLTPCYIARNGDYFAHGDTLQAAVRDAEAKALKNEPVEQRIERFRASYPDADMVISNTELYKWHNILTGSCEAGRQAFAREHCIDVETGSMTVREFIDLTLNAYGGQVIKQLMAAYNIKSI